MKHVRSLCIAIIQLVGLLSLGFAHADDKPQSETPKTNGRPVYLAAGKVVVFPEGVDEPPTDYKGSIGVRPLALIKFKDTIVGEVIAAPLERTTVDEAREMAASADKSDKVKLLERTTIKQNEDDVEVVTLRMDVKSNFGTPWIIHSLYFPHGKSSSTFKLVASEKEFISVLPYFEAMLSLGKDDVKPEKP